MEPFFFESAETELFAAYHPASDLSARLGIVLCAPYPAELTRVYKMNRDIAERWSEAGAHVLRFDYFGSGDSFGDWKDAGPARWVEDTVRAVQELKDISGVRHVALAGGRFGALVAVAAAARCDATGLILWDPELNGGQCRRHLEEVHQTLVDLHIGLSKEELRMASNELCGFEIMSWMDDELSNLALPAALPESVNRICIVETVGQHVAEEMMSSWERSDLTADYRRVDFDCAWRADPEAIVNGVPVIEELAKCL